MEDTNSSGPWGCVTLMSADLSSIIAVIFVSLLNLGTVAMVSTFIYVYFANAFFLVSPPGLPSLTFSFGLSNTCCSPTPPRRCLQSPLL